jgi:acyl-CoA synthetase (AMP-forming)/AMP-acid ligase II
MLALHAQLFPDKIGASDLARKMTFRLWHNRACRLANAFAGIGLRKGDRACVLAYNCVEWLELYAAAALAGFVIVPINFRLTAQEARYIVDNCEARALIVQDNLLGVVESIRAELPVLPGNFIHFGAAACPAGYREYEDLLASAQDSRPQNDIAGHDPWTLMYTSGTTGKPKGAIRNHRGGAMLSLVTEVELGISRRDTALLAMPMCHANSLYFFGAFSYCGAACTVYSRSHVDPEHLIRTLAEGGATFTSLVPTHYAMMLDLPAATRSRYNVDAVTKLMISSAPARRETKLAIMEYFKNSGLFELYGSTEAGWVTMLHPEEQLTKLGSVGRECVGSRPIRLLDADGAEVADGEAGELYSCNDYTFDGYWKAPDKTKEAFRGEYCTVGDMARRDADGHIYLIDRKMNMIISGGEMPRTATGKIQHRLLRLEQERRSS